MSNPESRRGPAAPRPNGRAMRRLRPLKFLTGAPSTYVGARLGRPGRTLFKPELLFKGFVIVEGAGTARCYPEHKRRWHAGARARRRRCVAVLDHVRRKRRRARFEPLPAYLRGRGVTFLTVGAALRVGHRPPSPRRTCSAGWRGVALVPPFGGPAGLWRPFG